MSTTKGITQKAFAVRILFITLAVFAAIVLTVLNSFSWFLDRHDANTDDLDLGTVSVGELMIYASGDSGDPPGTELIVNVDRILSPISGNGSDFFSPIFGDVALPTADPYLALTQKQITGYNAIAPANLDEFALVVDFTLKSTIENMPDFYLSSASSVTADLFDSPTINDLSAGHIAGAVRVALLKKENGGAYTLKCIWIPNEKCELTESSDWQYSVDFNTEPSPIQPSQPYKVNYTGIPEPQYFFRNDTADDVTEITRSIIGYREEDGVYYIWNLQRAQSDGITFDTGVQPNTEYQYRMILWVEGSDRECHNAFLGGKMKLDLIIEQGGVNNEE